MPSNLYGNKEQTPAAHLNSGPRLFKSINTLPSLIFTLAWGLQAPLAAVDAEETASLRHPCLEVPCLAAWECYHHHKRDPAADPPLTPWGPLLCWVASLDASEKKRRWSHYFRSLQTEGQQSWVSLIFPKQLIIRVRIKTYYYFFLHFYSSIMQGVTQDLMPQKGGFINWFNK